MKNSKMIFVALSAIFTMSVFGLLGCSKQPAMQDATNASMNDSMSKAKTGQMAENMADSRMVDSKMMDGKMMSEPKMVGDSAK